MSTRIYVGHLPPNVVREDVEDHFKKVGPLKDVMVKGEKGFAFVEYETPEEAEQAIRQFNDSDLNGYKIMVKEAYAKKEGGRDRGDRFDDRRDRDRDRYDDRRRDDYGGRRDRDDRRRDDSRDRDYRRNDRYDDRDRDRGGSRHEDRDRRDRYDDRDRDDRRSRYDRPRNTKWRVIVENLPSGTNWRDLKDFFRKAAEVTYADISRDRDSEGIADFASEQDMREAIRALDGTELMGQKVYLREMPSSSSPDRSGHRGRDDRDVPMRDRGQPSRGRDRSASPRGY